MLFQFGNNTFCNFLIIPILCKIVTITVKLIKGQKNQKMSVGFHNWIDITGKDAKNVSTKSFITNLARNYK